MSLYSTIAVASNLSNLVALVEAQQAAIMSLQRNATAPTVAPQGALWWDTTTGIIKQYDGSTWQPLLTPLVRHLAIDGSVAMTGNLPMGNNQIQGLGAGTNDGHATRKDQQILRDGSNAWTGNQPCGGFKLTGHGTPSDSADVATKGYVDTALANAGKTAHVAAVDIQVDSTDVINDLGFVPRQVTVRIYGDVVLGEEPYTSWEDEVDRTFVANFWDDESGKGFTPGDEWVSDLQNPGVFAWRLKLTRVNGSPKGFKLELVLESNGDRGTVDEFGSEGGPGVCQAFAIG